MIIKLNKPGAVSSKYVQSNSSAWLVLVFKKEVPDMYLRNAIWVAEAEQ